MSDLLYVFREVFPELGDFNAHLGADCSVKALAVSLDVLGPEFVVPRPSHDIGTGSGVGGLTNVFVGV